MAKLKTVFSCSECGTETSKWVGQCPSCEAWNSLTESVSSGTRASARDTHLRGLAPTSTVQSLGAIAAEDIIRIASGMSELDRVLGGGLVIGSVVLLGGDPGIGKSTLLLQALNALSERAAVLYVTGEESVQQVALRAQRLGPISASLRLLAETRLERILDCARQDAL